MTTAPSPLGAFFSTVPSDLPLPAGEVLAPLLDLQADLARPDLRITLFGAAKAGKTSLLNRLLGTHLVPERAVETSTWITAVTYGALPAVMTVTPGGTEQPLPFDDLQGIWQEQGGRAVREVRIAVPLPALAGGISLADTPGLLGEGAAAELAYRALERTDLAVMVLAADKILSAQERAAAAHAHDLLGGNIVFVVNRIDLIDPEDRAEVLAWAAAALRGMGNLLVGRPHIMEAGRGEQSSEVGRWLAALTARKQGAIRALARASVVRYRLTHALYLAQSERARTADELESARLRRLEDTMRERASAQQALSRARRRLEAVRADIAAQRAPFIARCVGDTLEQPAEGQVRLQTAGAVAAYTASVNEKVASALVDAPVSAPAFDLRTWLFRLQIDARPDLGQRIGGAIGDLVTRPVEGGRRGRDAGAAAGEWISRRVLGRDAEAETQRRVERLAHAALASIEQEVEEYLARLFALLDEAVAYYQTWMRPSPEVERLEWEEQRWLALLQWLQGFERAARRAADELLRAWPAEGGEPDRPAPG